MPRQFEDITENAKVKLAAAWAALIGVYIYADYLSFTGPARLMK